jgi:hypothetical protein
VCLCLGIRTASQGGTLFYRTDRHLTTREGSDRRRRKKVRRRSSRSLFRSAWKQSFKLPSVSLTRLLLGTLGATAVAAVGLRKNAISKNAIQHLGRLHARRDDKTQKGEMQNLLTDVRYTNGTRKLLPKRSTLKHRVCFTLSYSIGQNRTPASNPSRRAALACF